MKGCISQSEKLSRKGQGGQGRFCSNQLAGSGPNRNCTYRRNFWPGVLPHVSSFVRSVLRNLRLMVDREIEKMRIKSIEQRRQDRERSEIASRDKATQERMQIANPNEQEPSTDVKK